LVSSRTGTTLKAAATLVKDGFQVMVYCADDPIQARMLEDIGTLSAEHLNHYMSESDTFMPNEGLEIVCDPLPLSDYLTLWDRLRPRLPASATYVMRMALIDSDVHVPEGTPVQTRVQDIGVATG